MLEYLPGYHVQAANNICGIDAMHIARQEINLDTNSSQTNVFSSKTNVDSNLCLLSPFPTIIH